MKESYYHPNSPKMLLLRIQPTTHSIILREISGTEDKLPQFIFLDLNMPVKDGFGFLEDFEKLDEEVRKNYAKVIVLSSSISPEDINKASTNPFVYKYINKPLSDKYLEAI